MTDQQLKDRVQAIVQKTFTEHGFKNRPWGMTKDRCSYAAGCAIGLSISPELAQAADRAEIGAEDLLSECPEVRVELLGSGEEAPEWVLDCLNDVQSAHDTAAISEYSLGGSRRESYRLSLKDIARYYGFTLTEPEQA